MSMLPVSYRATSWTFSFQVPRKLAWYREGGILPVDEGGGEKGVLIFTDDLGGVDQPDWTERARIALGRTGTSFRVRAKARVKRLGP